MKTSNIIYLHCLSALLVLSTSLKGQSAYTFSVADAPYKSIINDSIISPKTSWEEISPVIVPLGFTAVIFDHETQQIKMDSRGLSIDYGDNSILFTPLIPFFGPTDSLAINFSSYGRYCDVKYTGALRKAQSTISYRTTGNTGSRVFEVEYRNCKYNTAHLDSTAFISNIIRIYEGSNIIEFHKGPFEFHQHDSVLYPNADGPMILFCTSNGFNLKKAYMLSGDAQKPTFRKLHESQIPVLLDSVYIKGEPTVGTIYRFSPDKSTAINENIEAAGIPQMYVVPNPVVDNLLIKGFEKYPMEYTIFDIVGKEVQKGVMNSEASISTAQLPKGAYVIRLVNQSKGLSFTK